ncbi:hypothetical protein PAE9249_02196 [Paenibacillus sp. CECT 9249]|nr:hypothetical protein [Paenibacillus sp. CECT 9249]CAH0119690.1 hypothetical protein PAE9249_02196 [Paenibacillus sp. CECT 9249]
MCWTIERIIHFSNEQKIIDGYCHFGFHDQYGNQYILDHDHHWIGGIDKDSGQLYWTAGQKTQEAWVRHVHVDLLNPTYLSTIDKETVVVVSSGNKKIFKINFIIGYVELLIDGEKWGLKDIGNCEYDPSGFLWVNEVTGCRVHKFNLDGERIIILGNGEPGFQEGTVSFENVQFNWIYDLRRGPDGNIYVLDSKNYCVRMINPISGEVERVAGNGKSGYSGDGGLAIHATFGSNYAEQFDGPWSLSLDEEGNLYIGDTQNHVVRMVDRKTGIISTIAGTNQLTDVTNHSPSSEPINPLELQLLRICSLDYADSLLFIPEWNGDLIVLGKSPNKLHPTENRKSSKN